MSRRKSIYAIGQENQTQQKLKEEFMSQQIDQNLRIIMLHYPICDSVKPHFAKGAFIKPNKCAFHHLIHFLFVIINAQEFRKRFRWPIKSTVDECEFRNQTLIYLNECHRKFGWPFGPFKMQIVLFPGGADFMRIVIELSNIAMRTIIRRSSTSIDSIEANALNSIQAGMMVEATENVYKSTSQFLSEIGQKTDVIRRNTRNIGRAIANSLIGTSLEPEHVLDKYGFLKTWESYQNFAVQHKIQISMLTLEHLCAEFKQFEERLHRIENKKLIVDLSRMKSLGLIEHYLTHAADAKLYDKLFQIFLNQIMPNIYRLMEVSTFRAASKLNIESNILERISNQLNSAFNRLDSCKIYDCIGINSTPAKNTSMNELNESDRCQLQQPNCEYWDKLLRMTPKIDQNIRTMSQKCSSRLSDCIEENDIIICPAENLNGRRFYSNNTTYETGISPYTTQELDPMSMLTNTLQRTQISKNSSLTDSYKRGGRATVFSNESNNNHPAKHYF